MIFNTFKAQAMEESISEGLLIRTDCTKALEPVDIKSSENDAPYAFTVTVTGDIVGLVNTTIKKEISSNCMAVKC